MKCPEKITDFRIDSALVGRGISRLTSCEDTERKAMKWKCDVGHTWIAHPSTLLAGFGCKRCVRRFSDKDVNTKLAIKGWILVSRPAGNSREKAIFKCNTGHQFEMILSNAILEKVKCPSCLSEKRKLTALEKIKDLGFLLVSDYVLANKKIVVECSHGHRWTPRYVDLVSKKSGCPQCARIESRSTNDDIDTALANYDVKRISDYSGDTMSKMDFVCKNNHIFSSIVNNVLRGSGCPKCSKKISSQEDKIYNLVSLHTTAIRSTREIIKPFEIDLYVPEYKLAVEVNGRYWHSEENGKDENYHLDKTKKCKTNGVTLLHFWDDEIDNKFDIVSSMILARIGKNAKINARECKLIELTNEESTKFLMFNHLNETANASIRLGLIHNGELVQVMTFSKPRFTKTADWEIIRLASKIGTTIVGGSSKLFSAFIRQTDANSVLSYADLRYSTGNVYKSLGFVHSHDSKPNYFYTKGDINLSRYAAQKHKLPKLLGTDFDENLSESENMQKCGYNKVYDCGNAVYIWRKS